MFTDTRKNFVELQRAGGGGSETFGRPLSEYAFQCGFLFSLLAASSPVGRGLWGPDRRLLEAVSRGQKRKGSPGIEAVPRTVRTASGGGAIEAVKPLTPKQPRLKRAPGKHRTPPAGLNAKLHAVLS